MKFKICLLLLCWVGLCNAAFARTSIRIGVQSGGTLEWELFLLQNQGFKEFQLIPRPLATPEAGKVALQSGGADIILSDWLWVSKMRGNGTELAFYPYSSTSGALLVSADSPIKSVKDLKGKRLGIAGGELDKNWLLLQALVSQDMDLNASVEKIFAAPPLLNEQLKEKRVDALLTYWHYAARLETEGYRQIIDGKGIMEALGVTEQVPTIGYVFKQQWAEQNKAGIKAYLKVAEETKEKICTDDATWKKIIPLTKTDDAATQAKLREGYCEGRTAHWGKTEQKAADRVYSILHNISTQKLTGPSETIESGTFWVND
jgi:NitT/TauT family transport system substrate-binding protein